jgi:hypothetical protein
MRKEDVPPGIQDALRMDSNWHFDEGKPRVDLIPVLSLIELGKVMDYGANKYGQHNWSQYAGRWAWTQLIASCLRHLYAWMLGEDLDKESGLNHLAHALANITMLLDLQIMDKGIDDRNPVYWNATEPDGIEKVGFLDSAGEPEHQLVSPGPSELEARPGESPSAWLQRVESPDAHRSFGRAASEEFEESQLKENKEWTELIDDELAKIHNIKLGLDPLEIESIPDMDIEEIPDTEIHDWDAPHGTTHSDELTFPPFAPETEEFWAKRLVNEAARILGESSVLICDEDGCKTAEGEELYP